MDLILVLRGLAALSVVVWYTVGYQNELPSLLNTPGRTAVWLFFGLSGYVIAYGFVHKRYKLTNADLQDFYINRFLRIYPLFLVLSLISYVTSLIINAPPDSVRGFTSTVVGLPVQSCLCIK